MIEDRRHEWWQLASICGFFAVAAVLCGVISHFLEGTFVVGFLLALFAYAVVLLPVFNGFFRTRSIQGTMLEISEKEILQIDASGATIGAVQLDKPYECEELYREAGHAAYRLRQFGMFGPRVDFLSSDPHAEHVIRELLEKEWPPPPPRSFYGH